MQNYIVVDFHTTDYEYRVAEQRRAKPAFVLLGGGASRRRVANMASVWLRAKPAIT